MARDMKGFDMPLFPELISINVKLLKSKVLEKTNLFFQIYPQCDVIFILTKDT